MVALRIKKVPIAELTPAAYNPRKISKQDMAALKRSLEEFGAVEPAVVNKDGTIIGGHQRIAAAEELGWRDFPVLAVDLSAEKARLLNLALNRISGAWDEPKLAELLEELQQADADIMLTGFTEAEVEQLLADSGPGAEDKVAEEPVKTRAKPGDLWLLGDHRLLCGDATDAAVVEKLMGGESAALMATDPPYGVEIDHTWREDAGLHRKGLSRSGKVSNDDQDDWREAWVLTDAPVAYVWHAAVHGPVVLAGLEAVGFEIRQQIVWVKASAPVGRSHYHWRHEPCWYAVRKGKGARWRGGRKQTSVWEASSPIIGNSSSGDDAKTPHPTQKPLLLFETPIRNHTKRGDVLYEPFAGSGTQLIAAERMERRCFALELDPVYCDVILTRWESETGKKAKRA